MQTSENKQLYSLEQMQECWNAGREFYSQDGVVNIHIIVNIPGADNSDLQPVYANLDDYLSTITPELVVPSLDDLLVIALKKYPEVISHYFGRGMRHMEEDLNEAKIETYLQGLKDAYGL